MSDCKCKIHGEGCGRMMDMDCSLPAALARYLAVYPDDAIDITKPPPWAKPAGVLSVPIASIPDEGAVVEVHQASHKAPECTSSHVDGPVSP